VQWHQLDHMQTTCTSLQTDNHTNTSSLVIFFTGRMLFLTPNQQCQSTEVPCKQSVICFSLVINHFSNPGRAICIACEFVFCKQNLDFDWPKYVALSIQRTRSLVKVLTYGVKIFVFGYTGSQFTDKWKYSKENHFNHKN